MKKPEIFYATFSGKVTNPCRNFLFNEDDFLGLQVRRKKLHPQITLSASYPQRSSSRELDPTSEDNFEDNLESTKTLRSSVPSELTADPEQSHTKNREVHRTWSISVEDKARQVDVHDHEMLVRKRDYMNNERLQRLFVSSHGKYSSYLLSCNIHLGLKFVLCLICIAGGLYDRSWNDDAVEVTPFGWRRRPDSEVIQPAANIRKGSIESVKKEAPSSAVMGDNDGDRDKQMMAGGNFGAVNEEVRYGPGNKALCGSL